MPGPVPKPKEQRRTRHKPQRGEWQVTPGRGWQHGPIPEPERRDDLSAESLRVWQTWLQSWWAAHWSPADLPGLTVAIHLYEQTIDYQREPFIEREYVTTKGDTRTTWVVKPNPVGELRQMMDNYGITPKGQQDRRWTAPKVDDSAPAEQPAAKGSRFAHLKVVNE